MAPVRVLILGHSFIHRLHTFLLRNFNAQIAKNLSLPGDLLIRWHRIEGRTVLKTRNCIHVVKEFARRAKNWPRPFSFITCLDIKKEFSLEFSWNSRLCAPRSRHNKFLRLDVFTNF